MNKYCAFVLSGILTALGIFAVYASEYRQDEIFAANRNAGKHIAITFDDGPHPKYTSQILDILKKYNAKATFFVLGSNAKKYPDLLKREFDEGHEIGNHSYSHPNMKTLSSDKILQEIKYTQDCIGEIIGTKPVIFRSPGGIYNSDIINSATSLGCKPVMWSWRQDTRDWEMPSVDKIVDTVLSNIRDGDIILFHDFNQKGSPTPKALDKILSELSKLGYTFVTVSELMDLDESQSV